MALKVTNLERIFKFKVNNKDKTFPDPNSDLSEDEAISLIALANPEIGNPKVQNQEIKNDKLYIICGSRPGTFG